MALRTYRVRLGRGWFADVRAHNPKQARYLGQLAYSTWSHTGKMVGKDAEGLVIQIKQTLPEFDRKR